MQAAVPFLSGGIGIFIVVVMFLVIEPELLDDPPIQRMFGRLASLGAVLFVIGIVCLFLH